MKQPAEWFKPGKGILLGAGEEVSKGSRGWSLQVAELATWGSLAVIFLLIALADLSATELRAGIGITIAMCAWAVIVFRVMLPRAGETPWLGWINLAVAFGFTAGLFAVVRGPVPSAQLVFVPVVAIAGLLTSFQVGVATGVAAALVYVGIADFTGDPPSLVADAVNTGIFILSGSVAGLLARELRFHYSAEQEEHRLATAVRHRLLAVLDAVDESIIFRDRQGIVRVVNQRAAELFGVDPDEHLGIPVVELLRGMARQTEDPEGFMETFQALRDDPGLEIRVSIEQVVPQRRRLRLYSGPALDDSGALIGRIDVYTDVTEAVRRAEEIERLYVQARETAESYQRGLLPDSVPKLPRISLVAHYIPARGRRAVCGDFYDFVTLQHGQVGVMLGDVCGVGPEAANDAALTRYTLRSFTRDESDPARLIERLNAHISAQLGSERFVRLMLGVLDPERASLEYVNAGHVPPVIYRSKTGEVEWLSEGGLALGIESDVGYKAARVDLHPGDMLVAYADGVTEGMRKGRVFGQAKLQDLIEQYGVGTPGEVVQAIRRSVEAWAPTDELRDDVALLVCQVVPDAAIGEPTRELLVPNEPARVRELRAFVATYLSDLRAPVEDSQEVVIAVGEAASNAYKYGRKPEGTNEIRIRCARTADDLVVTIADDGPGFDFRASHYQGLPDRFAAGGRGWFLMRQLMDSVEVDSSVDGTTVTLRRAVFAGRHL